MKMFLCGDVMTGRGIDQILRHPVESHLHEGYIKNARDYLALAEKLNGQIPSKVSEDYIWGDALRLWKERGPDLKIINLETAITTNETYFDKGINYRMHPSNIGIFTAAKIDICTLANNHILDWNPAGMLETISALKANHIKHCGAGKTSEEAQAPAIFENQEGRILVFAMAHVSSGVPLEWNATKKQSGVFLLDAFSDKNLQKIRALIEKYRQENDVVLVSIHWGGNWGYQVPQFHLNFAHALIDQARVNIIHGHSSHHPMPFEIYKGCPILYGCGDFINDYEGIGGHEEFRSDLCLGYFLNFETRPFRFQRLDLDCLKINRFRLKQASAEETNWVYQKLTKECAPFSVKLSRAGINTISVN